MQATDEQNPGSRGENGTEYIKEQDEEEPPVSGSSVWFCFQNLYISISSNLPDRSDLLQSEELHLPAAHRCSQMGLSLNPDRPPQRQTLVMTSDAGFFFIPDSKSCIND